MVVNATDANSESGPDSLVAIGIAHDPNGNVAGGSRVSRILCMGFSCDVKRSIESSGYLLFIARPSFMDERTSGVSTSNYAELGS